MSGHKSKGKSSEKKYKAEVLLNNNFLKKQ